MKNVQFEADQPITTLPDPNPATTAALTLEAMCAATVVGVAFVRVEEATATSVAVIASTPPLIVRRTAKLASRSNLGVRTINASVAIPWTLFENSLTPSFKYIFVASEVVEIVLAPAERVHLSANVV
jgi:hypothetical protein